MTHPTLDDAATLARRTLYDVAYAALVGASHLERARNLALLAADGLLPHRAPRSPVCTLCGAPMKRAPGSGRTLRLDWWRCSAKEHEYRGVWVEDAA